LKEDRDRKKNRKEENETNEMMGRIHWILCGGDSQS
jgi:hypothetical protein